METRRTATLYGAILAATTAVFAMRFWFVCDDAYITYRYARNLGIGRGLVFNPVESPPVEGYSDFLWLIGAAALEACRIRSDMVLPFVSTACAILLVLRVHEVARKRFSIAPLPAFLAALTLAASPAMGVWSTSGLETMPQALLTFLLFERLALRHDDHDWAIPALLGMALALIRTEGIAWVATIAAVSAWVRVREGTPLPAIARRLGSAALPIAVAYAMYTAWRFQYYGTLVPNTALVKVGFGGPLLARGAKYVSLFWATTLVPLLSLCASPLSLRSRPGAWYGVLLMAIAFPAYAVLVGGDFMPFGRMLIPGLPFAALLLAGGLHELQRRRPGPAVTAVGATLVVAGALCGADVHLMPERVRLLMHFRLSDKDYLSEFNRWANQRENTDGFTKRGLALQQNANRDDVVVAAAVGAIGYWSDLTILDQHGLVTKEVAYRPSPSGALTESPGHDKHVEPSFFVKYEPRFLYARAVWGVLAAGRMKDTLDQWEVPVEVMDRYVPDYFEAVLPGEEKAYLLVVRRREPGEDPTALWTDFAARRRALNTQLRAHFEAFAPPTGDEGGG